MGFDTSYHPVDLDLIQNRLVPYILGEGGLDDLVEQAVLRAQVRFRAKAWGLGAVKSLQPYVHVWGRPYLCTGSEPGADLARWQAVKTLAEADALGREMAPPGTQPQESGHLPEPAQLALSLRWKLDFLRDCAAALQRGESTVELNGQPKQAAPMLARESALRLLEFSAHLCPGWMDRGTWPTRIFGTNKFHEPRPLLGRLPERLPQVPFFLRPSIEENDMVGGYLPAEEVEGVRALVEEHQEAIIERTGVERESLQKLLEALGEARRRGLPFCEATEIYSGPAGIMN